VFVGDAAGWSDPIIGQGLSVAMRDARSVADVLTASDDWSPSAFEPYAIERAERMRRLGVVAAFDTALRCTFSPEGRARRVAFNESVMTDPMALGLFVGALGGPEVSPAEVFEQDNIDRLLALA
jgi:2-polyprenyl-6-methoxyphenol hydroxylase-like FAD-dependent oxidoreductase